MDPKTSRWMSADPALGEYIPGAPINDEVKKQKQNLPGMGGVFNYVNMHLYHYAGNNPVKYLDPDGESLTLSAIAIFAAKIVVPLIVGAIIHIAIKETLNTSSSSSLVGGTGLLAPPASSWTASRDSSKDLAIPIPLTQTQTRTREDNGTTLYRAVDAAELASISETGTFLIGNGSTYEYGKLFTLDPSDAFNYANDANKSISKSNPYVAVVAATAPSGSFSPMYISDAKSAVFVPTENLPSLKYEGAVPLLGDTF